MNTKHLQQVLDDIAADVDWYNYPPYNNDATDDDEEHDRSEWHIADVLHAQASWMLEEVATLDDEELLAIAGRFVAIVEAIQKDGMRESIPDALDTLTN